MLGKAFVNKNIGADCLALLSEEGTPLTHSQSLGFSSYFDMGLLFSGRGIDHKGGILAIVAHLPLAFFFFSLPALGSLLVGWGLIVQIPRVINNQMEVIIQINAGTHIIVVF